MLFEDEIGIPHCLFIVDEGAAVERTQIEEAAYQVSRFLEIPVEHFVPFACFLFQEAFKVNGGKLAQIDEFARGDAGDRLQPCGHVPKL